MRNMTLVPSITDLDTAWLAEFIGIDDARSVSLTQIGSGQVANCYRLEITRADSSLLHIVAKVPSNDATSRATANVQHLYEREVAFYQFLATDVATRTPKCHFAQRDLDDNFLLVLEDLSPSVNIDQFTGLSLDVARTGLGELAGLHGPTHARHDLLQLAWLGGVVESLRPLYEAVLPVLFDQFLVRYADHLEHDVRDTVVQLGERLGLYGDYAPPHPCVTHGDFRTDNLLIGAGGGDVAMAVVDWQTIGVGSPLLDVAYFLTTSLDPLACARHDEELLDYYLAELAEYDVHYAHDIARHEFARYTLQPILMLVAASMIVEQTERGDQMFLEMIRRGVLAATRWDALGELERHAAR